MRASRAALSALIVLLGAAAPASASAAGAPQDPLVKYQWHLAAIQIPAAWEASRGAGATVAILDTGVAYENRGPWRQAPELAGARFVPGWDFVDGDAYPDDVPPRDGRRSHGTQIATIIAATAGNGIGGAGVAPDAAIMPIRVLSPDLAGSAGTIARGLRFAADHGADVANLSIAGRSPSRALRAAVRYAAAKGVTIVAASGNDGRATVSWPAAYPGVIAVGAVDRARRRAYYSNYGAALDLVAPGGAGANADTGFGPSDGVQSQTLKGGRGEFCFCFMASTSAAAAQVSGVAALLVGSGRASRPAVVAAALRAGARDLGPPGRDREYGDGLVQAAAALGAGPAGGGAQATARSGERDDGSGPAATIALVAGLAALAALATLAALRARRRRRSSG